MLKYTLFASAMLMSAPVMAQQTPAPQQTPPVAQPAPTPPAPAPADPAQAQPMTQDAAPAQDSMSATPAAPAQSTAQAAPAQPMTKAQQIAQVVDTEFASYDKDGNGVLSPAEFDAWMIALKTAADPSTKADTPATKSWLNQAFAQADKDKSKTVSKTELSGFLVAGNS